MSVNLRTQAVALWRNEWPTSMFGPPHTGSGKIAWETCARPALSTPHLALPAPLASALMGLAEAVEAYAKARGDYDAGLWVSMEDAEQALLAALARVEAEAAKAAEK